MNCPNCGAEERLRSGEWIFFKCDSYLREDTGMLVSDGCNARKENNELKERVKDLERWKAEAIAIQNEWDMQAIATMLGAQCGQSCLRVINERVPKLVEDVKRLERDSERLHWLLKRGVAWRGCYDALWLQGEWLYLHQEALATIDEAIAKQPIS